MKKILQYPNPRLELISESISDVTDPKYDELINEMLKILSKESDRSAGLSAPQIGVLERVVICRRTDLEPDKMTSKPKDILWEVMINPILKKISKETSKNWEGCLSVNDGDLFGKVERPVDIEVEFYDIFRKKKKLNASKFFSHVVQHEIDHLNGVLFLKYISDPSKLITGEEFEDAE